MTVDQEIEVLVLAADLIATESRHSGVAISCAYVMCGHGGPDYLRVFTMVRQYLPLMRPATADEMISAILRRIEELRSS